jgi:hypothetical protein
MPRAAWLVLLAACRSYAVPNVSRPSLAPDVQITATSETAQVKTGTHDVCDGESRCRTEDVTRDEQRTRITAGTAALSYGQLRLVDPQGGAAYEAALAEYARRAKPCRDARKWKIAGIVTTVVGGVIALIDGAPTGVRIGGLALAGAGVVGIVIGVKKGSGCDAVYRFGVDNQIDIAEDTVVADRKKEIEEIAARFNSRPSAPRPP